MELDPKDGKAVLYLGHLLFHLGRHTDGRAMWKKAAELGAEPVIACRALGMASLNLDHDPEAAAKYLTQANEADPTDAIVARDLARCSSRWRTRRIPPGRRRSFGHAPATR